MKIRDVCTHYTPRYFNSKEEWEKYADYLRQQILVGVGLAPFPEKTALNEFVFGRVEYENEGYLTEKVYFEALPGYFVTGVLYRPLNGEQPAPAILSPHGHWPHGRLHDHGRFVSVPGRCIELAKMGFVVFSYDMMGYNDSCQVEHRVLDMVVPYGFSPMGIQTWSSIRALDFLESLPYVDSSRIGATGASGGGTQVFIVSAIDSRITACAPVCMISYHMQGGCKCENSPLLRINATSVDIARLFAPKPMFMGSTTGDWTKNTLEEELPAVKHIYEFYDKEDVLHNHHVDASHNYNEEICDEVYKFFNKYLLDDKGRVPEVEHFGEFPQRPLLRDQMVWWGIEKPKPLSQTEFLDIWCQRNKNALAKASDDELIGYLPFTLAMNEETILEYCEKDLETIVVNRDGDCMGIDSLTPDYANDLKEAPLSECYNHTLFAIRVHEIIAVLQREKGIKYIMATGESGVALLMALAIKSFDVDNAIIELNGCDMDDENSVAEYFDTPSICQVGGSETILKGVKKYNPNCLIHYK